MKVFFIRVVIILTLLICSGCESEEGEARIDNYLERLARVLQVELPVLKSGTDKRVSQYPFGFSDRLETSQSIKTQSISVLDFLSLYGCELQVVIAESNSSLGKFAPRSQVLLRHLRFLHHAPACIKQLDGISDAALIDQLKAEVLAKQAALPFMIWRALLNEREAKSFWLQPSRLGTYPEQVSIDPELSIKRLTYLSDQWMNANYLEGINELELRLGDINRGDGGQLLKALNTLSQKLNQANELITRYLAQEPCTNDRAKIDKGILQNVIEKFFVGEVQVWASELSRRYYSLIEAYVALEEQFVGVETESYRAWRQERDRQFAAAMAASSEHVSYLKRVISVCDNKSR